MNHLVPKGFRQFIISAIDQQLIQLNNVDSIQSIHHNLINHNNNTPQNLNSSKRNKHNNKSIATQYQSPFVNRDA